MDDPNEELAVDHGGDQTQPTADIVAALNGASTSSIKTEPADDTQSHHSEYESLFSRLSTEDPHDPDGWRRLIDLATTSGEIRKVQQTYDELLKHYPNTVSI